MSKRMFNGGKFHSKNDSIKAALIDRERERERAALNIRIPFQMNLNNNKKRF